MTIGHLLNRTAYVYHPRRYEDAAGTLVERDEAAGRTIRCRVRTATRRETRDAAVRYELSHVIYANVDHGLKPNWALEVDGIRYRILGERPLSITTHHSEIDALRVEVPD